MSMGEWEPGFASTFDWLPTDNSPTGEEGVSYVYDYNNVRFIGITSDQESGPSQQISGAGLNWLESVLQNSSAFDHIFVFTHHPVSFFAENNFRGTAGDFWQLLVTYDVTGVFSDIGTDINRVSLAPEETPGKPSSAREAVGLVSSPFVSISKCMVS